MSVTISKKDTWDIADGISLRLEGIRNLRLLEEDIKLIREIIEEELNDWISDCETEQSQMNDLIGVMMVKCKIERMIDEQKDEISRYVTIDIDELSSALAEEDWRKETLKTPESDLYELVVSDIPGEVKNVKMEKQVKPHWTTLFFSLKESYVKLIKSYTIDKR